MSKLGSLDISTVIDTVNHALLLARFQSENGITDTPLMWIKSVLLILKFI